MLTLPRHVRVFVGTEPFDMRGSFDAMAGRVRRLGLEPVDGNLYVAHYTPDRIDRIAPDGTVDILVEDWEAVHLNAPTNIAFAGPDLSLIVAACVGEEFLAIADLGIRGQPLRRPMLDA